jgi:hypothetical protein
MKPSGARTTPLGNGLESNTPAFERGLCFSCKSSSYGQGSNPRSSEAQSTESCCRCHSMLENRLSQVDSVAQGCPLFWRVVS